MTKHHTARQDKVSSEIEKTYSGFKLYPLEDLCTFRDPILFKRSDMSRFYREKCDTILSTWSDISSIFHLLPKSYQKKLIASREFERLFQSQILSTLQNEVQDKEWKNKLDETNKEYLVLQQLYSNFLTIGLEGITKLMPLEFQNIIKKKLDEVFELMQMVTQYSNRIAPRKAKLKNFPYSIKQSKRV